MARAPRKSKKTGPVRVNFKGVETRNTPPEGDYAARVLTFEQGESSAGNDQFAMTAEISRGEFKGQKLYMYFPLAENSLWKLASFLGCVGIEVPQDEMDVDPEEVIGKEFVAVVHHETYNGKKQAKIGDFDSLENFTGDLPEDDKGKKSKKKDKKGKSKDEPEEKSSKKDKGKKGKDKTPEPEPEAKKSKKDKKAKDEPEPKADKKDKGKKDKKSKTPKFTSDEVAALSAKDLKKFIKTHELDVDLDDYKTDRKKVGAVCDALEEKDMLAD
jgi:hypothetical protein